MAREGDGTILVLKCVHEPEDTS